MVTRWGTAVASAGLIALLSMASRPSVGQDATDGAAAPVALPDDSSVADTPGEVEVVLLDGRSFRGTLIREDAREVVIRIAGIETKFPAKDVAAVNEVITVEEYHRTLRDRIADDDYENRLRLCHWLHHRGRIDLALEELDSLLTAYPGLESARDLRRLLEAKQRLSQAPAVGNEQGSTQASPTARPDRPRLTEAEMNLLRVFETNLDNPPRLIIPRETLLKLFQDYPDSPLLPRTEEGRRAFLARPAVEQLDVMFRLGARHLYGEVRVLSEPDAFVRFRRDVHRTWLSNSCATAQCHGGAEAGALQLLTGPSTDLSVVYTNFLILERTRIDGQPLINHDDPASSLLLEMGLPPWQTNRTHPEVRGWRPVFRDRSDPVFFRSVEWINSLYHPRPAYPVDFTPPGMSRVASGGPEGIGEGGEPAPEESPER